MAKTKGEVQDGDRLFPGKPGPYTAQILTFPPQHQGSLGGLKERGWGGQKGLAACPLSRHGAGLRGPGGPAHRDPAGSGPLLCCLC